jgi:hypothetical protein
MMTTRSPWTEGHSEGLRSSRSSCGGCGSEASGMCPIDARLEREDAAFACIFPQRETQSTIYITWFENVCGDREGGR